MVTGHPTACSTAVLVFQRKFKQREVDHPQHFEHFGIAQAQTLCHFEAQRTCCFAGEFFFARQYQNQIACLGIGRFSNGFQFVFAVKFINATLETTIGIALNIYQTLHANLWTLHPFGEFIYLLAGIFCSTGHSNGEYSLRIIKHTKAGTFNQFTAVFVIYQHMVRFFQVQQLHFKADIGLVVAIVPQGIVVRHALHSFAIINAFYRFENVFHQPLKHVEDIVLLHETHFAVNLRKLGLAVGPQVFIAEAFYNLIVAIVAAHHEQLLKGLRTLRQRIKLSGIHTAGHYKITGPFGSALDEKRRFNIHETILVQIISCGTVYRIAQLNIFLHCIAAQVEVAVFHPQVVATIGIILNGEGWRSGFVENAEFADGNFYIAGSNVGVFAGSFAYHAFCLQHKLTAQRIAVELVIQGFGKYQLRNAVAVTQVYEGDGAKFAYGLHPAGQGYFGAGMFQSQFATSMCSVHDV